VNHQTRRIAAWGAAISLAACGGHATLEGASPDDGFECASPEPILQKDTKKDTNLESGFVRCSDGFVHREAPAVCAAPSSPGDCNVSGGDCESDAGCTLKPHGSCVNRLPYEAWKGCVCTYGCATDADCSAGDVCACAGVTGSKTRCVSGDCTTTAGCGESLCGLSVTRGSCGETWARLGCLSSEDACRVDADCAAEPLASCFNEPEQPKACKRLEDKWVCTDPDECGPCG
jgi:hypothetical protein